MNRPQGTGKHRIPDEQKKFSFSLSADLAFSPEDEARVVIHANADESNRDELLATVRQEVGEQVYGGVRSGKMMISAVVQPPNIRGQLIGVAAIDAVELIDASKPMMPPGVPKSHFQ